MGFKPSFFHWLSRGSYRLRPELEHRQGPEQLAGTVDVVGLLYSAPLVVLGLIWLAFETDLGPLAAQPVLFGVLALLGLAYSRLTFFVVTNIETGTGDSVYADTAGSLTYLARWAGILLLGPVVLWIDVVLFIFLRLRAWRNEPTADQRWLAARNLLFSLAETTFWPLAALSLYRRLGGPMPPAGLSLELMGWGGLVLGFMFVAGLVQIGPYLAYSYWVLRQFYPAPLGPVIRVTLLGVGLPLLALPFGFLAAGLYAQNGLGLFVVLNVGVLLVALMARSLSLATETSRQQSNEMKRLEELGRAILNSRPDGSALREVLEEHFQGMFLTSKEAIWTEAGFLLKNPSAWEVPEFAALAAWVQAQAQAHSFLPQAKLPWQTSSAYHDPLVITPIVDTQTKQVVGGVYIELSTISGRWNERSLGRLRLTLQTLAAQVASALHQIKVYEQTLAHQKMLQELSIGRKIQQNFLPRHVPEVAGWQLTAGLQPARQTSGDFYDLIPLPGGRLGILIADVADKGVGPALFMALSRTLIRTFAFQFENQPAEVLEAANRRILEDAGESLFVTVFYGVLEPQSGVFRYCNAGHNPPGLFRARPQPELLGTTGIPLGIDEEEQWDEREVVLKPGDTLVLYTDGVPDAENPAGEHFEMERLMAAITPALGQSAQGVFDCIMAAIDAYGAGAAQFDDITLVIVKRD